MSDKIVPFPRHGAEPTALDRAIGGAIHDRRLKLGLSQTDLARRLEVGTEDVRRYELGELPNSPSAVVRIARALGLTASALLSPLAIPPRPKDR